MTAINKRTVMRLFLSQTWEHSQPLCINTIQLVTLHNSVCSREIRYSFKKLSLNITSPESCIPKDLFVVSKRTTENYIHIFQCPTMALQYIKRLTSETCTSSEKIERNYRDFVTKRNSKKKNQHMATCAMKKVLKYLSVRLSLILI